MKGVLSWKKVAGSLSPFFSLFRMFHYEVGTSAFSLIAGM